MTNPSLTRVRPLFIIPKSPKSRIMPLRNSFFFLNVKPPVSPDGTDPVGEKVVSTGPKRNLGQGILRRGKPKGKTPDPDMRLRAFMSPPMTSPPEKPEKKSRFLPTREKTHRAYWDVAGTFSLIINIILVAVLVVMAGQIKNLKNAMNGLLGGLYSNFVELDKANISTTIPVEAQIPVVFSLPIQQNTNVTLTSDISIPHTGVVINSAGLSINAGATITLPEGTSLPIALNMDIPVQLSIPISLQIPVNIPMNQTSLHVPFTGLQETIKPLYCTLDKNAQYPEGIYICGGQTNSSAVNP
jgi:hypothetical protein